MGCPIVPVTSWTKRRSVFINIIEKYKLSIILDMF